MVHDIVKKVPIIYTGRTKNSTKLLKPFHLYAWFVAENRPFFQERYAYTPTSKGVGTRGQIWEHYRNDVIPMVLAELKTIIGVNEELTHKTKNEIRTVDAQKSVKCLSGWEWNKGDHYQMMFSAESFRFDNVPLEIDKETCPVVDPPEEDFAEPELTIDSPPPPQRKKRKRGGGLCTCSKCGGQKQHRASQCERPCPEGAM